MGDPRFGQSGVGVSEASVETRARFITRTYGHLVGAILAFVALEIFMFKSGIALNILQVVANWPWLVILGAFMVVGWIARGIAHSSTSPVAQYAALAAYVVAEALIFVPLLVVAEFYAPGVIGSAALVTAVGFTGLSGVVFMTRNDFSFLGGVLRWAGVVALLLIVAGALFGFQLGTFFSVGMIALAGGAVLYDTSNVLHHYPEDRYVAASLELFASIALMLWYVIRLFLASRN
jgi:FtsH-binding integral membrane protein